MGRPKKQSKGLGDTVEKVIKAVGLDIFVEGKDCGCEGRKETLNKLFPYRFKSRCMTEKEYNEWGEFTENKTLRLSNEQVVFVCTLFSELFNRKYYQPCSSCGTQSLIDMIDKIDKVYELYKKEIEDAKQNK